MDKKKKIKSEKVKKKSKDIKYKKKPISKALKTDVWNNYFSKLTAKCPCCGEREISAQNYEAGHIKSEKSGGETNINNLIPVCGLCNKSMGTNNFKEFMWDNYKRDFNIISASLKIKKTTGGIADKILGVIGLK